MCVGCLNKVLEGIEEYDKDVKKTMENIHCECCKSYPNFLLGVNQDLKVLSSVKIKQYNCCIVEFRKLKHFEGMVRQRIKNKLDMVVEKLDEVKEDITDNEYLTKMNNIKNLYDCIEAIDNADHN
jgi:hypothetical protein